MRFLTYVELQQALK